jgi:hypothetical protein
MNGEIPMAYAYVGTILAAPLSERAARPSLLARLAGAITESRTRAARRALNERMFLIEDARQIIGETGATLPGDTPNLPFAR